MQTTAMLATVLGLAAAVPAAAQDHPAVMQPSRDVMVEYHVAGVAPGQQRSDTVRMYFTDHATKVRIEPVGQPAYSIVDRNAARMVMVSTQQHAYMEMPYDPKQVMAFDDKSATFTRLGSATVAGIVCTVYDTKRQDWSGQVCLSDDGLMLRSKSDNPSQAGTALEATSVTYGPLPPSLFTPPADFQKMDLSGMGRGAPGSGH
jgi:Domain of unknown function (DUF4412)